MKFRLCIMKLILNLMFWKMHEQWKLGQFNVITGQKSIHCFAYGLEIGLCTSQRNLAHT